MGNTYTSGSYFSNPSATAVPRTNVMPGRGMPTNDRPIYRNPVEPEPVLSVMAQPRMQEDYEPTRPIYRNPVVPEPVYRTQRFAPDISGTPTYRIPREPAPPTYLMPLPMVAGKQMRPVIFDPSRTY